MLNVKQEKQASSSDKILQRFWISTKLNFNAKQQQFEQFDLVIAVSARCDIMLFA